MTQNSLDPKSRKKPAAARDERLKAALKANMARRKAQAKAREGRGPAAGQGAAGGEDGPDPA